MQELAELFKALADDTRLCILAMLLKYSELCVCDFEGALGITQSKSSRHLRNLLNAGLVQNRREGAWMLYRLTDKPNQQQQQIHALLHSLFETGLSKEVEDKLQGFRNQRVSCCQSHPDSIKE